MSTTVFESRPALDAVLRELRQPDGKVPQPDAPQWADLLKRSRRLFHRAADEWVRLACDAKGISADSQRAAEEWLGGPFCVLRYMRQLERSMRTLAAGGTPTGNPRRVGGRLPAVDILPDDIFDRLFYRGFRAEIRLQSSIESDLSQALLTQEWRRPAPGKVALVLGAGNVTSIAPMDALTKMVVERKAVLVKTHPVLDSLGPLIERTFSPFIEAGLLRVVSGGARTGSYLCRHASVDEIHITGSDRTHDAIVFGSGEEGTERRRENRPLLDKPITSELGNVSPVIVVPGRWSAGDIAFHAANVASMLANNAGFNCNAARLIVLSRSWSQKGDFMEAIRRVLSGIRPRKAWYPGSIAKHQRFMEAYPAAQRFGAAGEGELPWTLIGPLDPERDEIGFREEAFCGLFGLVELEGADIDSFLPNAVRFVNQKVWGTLNACLIVDPRTARAHRTGVEDAIDGLRYGTVCLNHWPAVGYALASLPWGAYPGHAMNDIQSGRGFVHNAFLYGGIEKAVIRGPFRLWPHPPWFVTRKRSLELARMLTEFEAEPSFWRVPRIFRQAMRR